MDGQQDPSQTFSPVCVGTLKADISLTEVVEKSEQVRKILEPVRAEVLADFESFRNPDKEFELLKLMAETSRHKHYLVNFMNKQNRYSEVKIIQQTAVQLGEENDPFNERYINANFIVNPFTGKQRDFIATQGPLPTTFYNFWRMVDRFEVKRIYMFCRLEEDGRKKCDQYWPTDLKSPIIVQKELRIELVDETRSADGFKVTRTIVLTNLNTEATRQVLQVQVTGWPDQDIPSQEDLPLIFDLVDECIAGKSVCPDIIHCSAGIGRTGTFMALYYLRLLFQLHKLRQTPFEASIFGLVRNLKEQRFMLLNKAVQYRLLYEAAAAWLKADKSEG